MHGQNHNVLIFNAVITYAAAYTFQNLEFIDSYSGDTGNVTQQNAASAHVVSGGSLLEANAGCHC